MDREQSIRERAYAIWQAEGEPAGSHDQHWDRAAREIDATNAATEAAATAGETAAQSEEVPPPTAAKGKTGITSRRKGKTTASPEAAPIAEAKSPAKPARRKSTK
jgi:hypothetical protein